MAQGTWREDPKENTLLQQQYKRDQAAPPPLGAGLKQTSIPEENVYKFDHLTPEDYTKATGQEAPTFHPEPGQKPQLRSEVQQWEDPDKRAPQENPLQFLQDFWDETGDSDAGKVLEIFGNLAVGIPDYASQKAKEYARETQGTDAHLTAVEIAGLTSAVAPLLKKAPQLLPHLQKLGVGFPALQHTLKQVIPTLDEAAEFAMDVFNPLADLKPALAGVPVGTFTRSHAGGIRLDYEPPTVMQINAQSALGRDPALGGQRRTGLKTVQGPFSSRSQLKWNKRGGVDVIGPDGKKVRKADPLAVEVAAFQELGGNLDELYNRAYTQGMSTPPPSQIAQYQKRYGLSKKTATHAHHILEHSLFGNAVGQMKNKGKAFKDLERVGFLPGNTAWQMLDVPGGFKGSSHQGWFHSKQMNDLPARGTLQKKLGNGEFAKMNHRDQIDLLTRTAGEAELTAVFWIRWKEATMMAANPQFADLVNTVNSNRSEASIKALREYIEQNKNVMKIGTGQQPSVQEVISGIYKKNQPMANPQLKNNLYTSLSQQVIFNTKIRNKPGMTGMQRYLPLERNQ